MLSLSKVEFFLFGFLCNLRQWPWPPVACEEKIAPNSREKPIACPLTALPPEIMLHILNHLDVVSLVCIRSANRAYHHFVPAVGRRNLSRCEEWLITCRFEKDMKTYPARVACALCKTKHDQSDFAFHGKNGIKHVHMMASDPVERYCYRHLTFSMCYPPAFRYTKESRWVRSREWTCLHCGGKPSCCGQVGHSFLRPPVCSADAEGERCCSICPSAYLSTYIRLGPIKGIPSDRHDSHLLKSSLVRRSKMGFRLEMKESNSKTTPLPSLPPLPHFESFIVMNQTCAITDYRILIIAAELFSIDFIDNYLARRLNDKPKRKTSYPPDGIHLLNVSEYRFIWRRAGGQILTGSSVSESKSNLVYTF